MDPMCPLPHKGDTHGLIVTLCCSHKLLNFAPYMKETSVSWVIQTCHALFAVWGRGWCNFLGCHFLGCLDLFLPKDEFLVGMGANFGITALTALYMANQQTFRPTGCQGCCPTNHAPVQETKISWCYLEDPFVHKKCSGQLLAFERLFLLKSHSSTYWGCLVALAKSPGENEPATRAQFSATRAQIQKVCKANALCGNPFVCVCLHLPALAPLSATKARANICVSMGRAGSGESRYSPFIMHGRKRHRQLPSSALAFWGCPGWQSANPFGVCIGSARFPTGSCTK